MADCIPLALVAFSNVTTPGSSLNWSETNRQEPELFPQDGNWRYSGAVRHNGTGADDILVRAEHLLYSKVVTLVCVAGLVGNALNMAVLTRRRLQAGMTTMERTVYMGLAALALSDMMFCACVLPHAWVPRQFYFMNPSFNLYYSLYSDALINVFVMCSTWLTVAMAISRYVAICRPLQARCVISGCRARISIVVIFLLCIVCNLPRFWKEVVDTMECIGGWSVYFRSQGIFKQRQTLHMTYICTYFIFATVLPFTMLMFCNIRLVKALRKSLWFREPGQSLSAMGQSDTHRISLTLAMIVLMYTVLVLPAEVSTFLRLSVMSAPNFTSAYNVIVGCLNLLQASNFAFHFVLYCVVNVHFRHSMKAIFTCSRNAKDKRVMLHDCEQAVALTNGETTAATTL